MHKHLQNLERLCPKLQFRYGDDDDLVMQLKCEIGSLDTSHSKNHPKESQGRCLQDNAESAQPIH